MSEQMDNFDLEVSRLASPSPTSPSLPHDDDAPTAECSDGAHAKSPPRRIAVAAGWTRRQRLQRGGVFIVLLTVLIAAVFFIPAGNRDALIRALTLPPTPTDAPLPGDDAFLWDHSVPWGQLFIDGKHGPDVSGSPVRRSAEGYWEGVGFHLPRGRHLLAYRAAPFPTLTCVVSVPSSSSDTCPLDSSGDYSFLTPSAPATRLLDLQAIIDHLPKAQVTVLIAGAQATLTAFAANLPSGSLTIGDHYLDAAGQPEQALTPLRVKPQYQLDVAVKAADGSSCVALCTPSGPFPSDSAPDTWSIQAPVALGWRYMSAAGLLLQDAGPATLTGTSPVTVISLSTRWQDGTWQTPTLEAEDVGEIDPVICSTGAHALDVLRATPGQTTVDEHFQVPYVAPTAELGCLLAGSEIEPTTGNSTGPIALVFYRAGVLVAANSEAQRAFPKLLVASAHEQALAQAVAPSSL